MSRIFSSFDESSIRKTQALSGDYNRTDRGFGRLSKSSIMPATRTRAVDDERRALVERVLSSELLTRSARLRDLLVYLTGRVFEDASVEIHEQEVGREVFGRPADYDTGSDNIVRVHASTLRKRLERYFSEEGAAEPLILEIPKGNYAPTFRERSPAIEPV